MNLERVPNYLSQIRKRNFAIYAIYFTLHSGRNFGPRIKNSSRRGGLKKKIQRPASKEKEAAHPGCSVCLLGIRALKHASAAREKAATSATRIRVLLKGSLALLISFFVIAAAHVRHPSSRFLYSLFYFEKRRVSASAEKSYSDVYSRYQEQLAIYRF